MDKGSFTLKGYITCKAIACANWLLSILHQIGPTVYVPTDLDINTALAANLDTNLLGTFTYTSANMEPLHVHKTV